jgi:hypothetical protein
MPPPTTMPEGLRESDLHPGSGRTVDYSFPSDCFRRDAGVSVLLIANSAYFVSWLVPHSLDSIEHTLTPKPLQIPGLHIYSASEGGSGNLQ